jgi:uncharacterized protein HemX
MDDNRLSDMYSKACARLQQAAADLYEDLHTNQGDPKTDVAKVTDVVGAYRRWLLVEADFIRELAKEYGEKNGGKSEQA